MSVQTKTPSGNRDATILAETDRHRIWGTVNYPSATRLSDFLNRPDVSFLALTDVTVEIQNATRDSWQVDFMALNLAEVTFITPLEESAPHPGTTPITRV